MLEHVFEYASASTEPRHPAFTAAVARMVLAPSAGALLAAGARIADNFGEPSWALVGDHDAVARSDPAPFPDGTENPFASWQEQLDDGGLLLDLLREEQRTIGAAEARRARWVVDFCRSRPSSNDRPDDEIGAAAAASRAARPAILVTVSEWAVDEVATALSITAAKATAWMVQSLQLVDLLPATLDALGRGELTWDHAAALCQVLAPVEDDALRAQAEGRLLARLGHKTPTQLRAAAHRVVQRLDGQAIGRRVETALRERNVQVFPTGDGLGSLSVTNLPLPVLRAVEDALRQYADAAKTPDDHRTRQQRMVDALIDLVLRPGEHGLAPVQARLTVIATVRTLLGDDDPGEVSGDVLPADTVRALARALGLLPAEPAGTATSGDPDAADSHTADAVADVAALLGTRDTDGTALAARPHIAVTDELTGQLLALTTASELRAGRALRPPPPTDAYEPTAELRRHVTHRDRRCRFPGCRRPGRRCDLHHVTRYPLGETSADNLCCLCRHHHRLVHQAPGWHLHALPDGSLRFTTPTGQVLVTRPAGVMDDDPPPAGQGSGSPPGGDPPTDDPPPF
jgi:hypothetical protein